MIWKSISGYKYPYRISEEGEVQKYDSKKNIWISLKPKNHRYAVVMLTKMDGKHREISLSSLMDQAFFGGYARKNGLVMYHRNGSAMDCSRENLIPMERRKVGKIVGGSARRTPVAKVERNGERIFYRSLKEAAEKNGMSSTAAQYRIKNGIYDPAGWYLEYDFGRTGVKNAPYLEG